MRGIVMIRGQSYVQLLDEIDIKDPEAIRRVVRQAVTLPPIDEVARQGIKGCVSGPIASLLGTSTSPPTWVEQQAANDIQKLWKRGKSYQIHIKRLIQDCDVTMADFLVLKGVEGARKNCLQAQDEERENEQHRKLLQPDSDEYQDLSDEENDQRLHRTSNDAHNLEKRNVAGQLREGNAPNKKQKRTRSVAEKSSTRSNSTEMQDFENQENRIEFTPVNKPVTHGIYNSEKQAGKPKNGPGTLMLRSLRDHNTPAIEITKSPDKPPVRQTRNSQKRGENSGIGSNEIAPPPHVHSQQIDSRESQILENALIREMADHNNRGGQERLIPIGKKRDRQTAEQQPEPIIDSEDENYTPEPRIAPYKKKVGRGGARRGPAWEKIKAERESYARSSNYKNQDDQPGGESNPIGIEDGSDNETVVHEHLDNQQEDVEMEDVQ